ncbi:unnamed protein product [Ectocarpus sp. CCAP 1310/34]|nr:unnamed protein product [Ectocarpus sp. CCAP 1310/34]
MISCGPGDRGVIDNVSGRGTIASARHSVRVNRTINLMSRGTLVFVFAAAFLGELVVLLVSAGDRCRSMMLPPERPTIEGGLKATLPLSKKKSDASQTNGDKDTGSATHTPGTTEGGGTLWRASRALEKAPAVVLSPADEPTMNVRTAEDQHPPSRVAVFVYEGVPELDHMELVQCYRDVHGVAPWQDERFDMAQDMGEIWMHRSNPTFFTCGRPKHLPLE